MHFPNHKNVLILEIGVAEVAWSSLSKRFPKISDLYLMKKYTWIHYEELKMFPIF